MSRSAWTIEYKSKQRYKVQRKTNEAKYVQHGENIINRMY